MNAKLQLVLYPDPRLKKMSQPVERFDDELKDIVSQMFELMRQHKGVGLAAPQVGLNLRIFVINPTGEPADNRAYVNPELLDANGTEEGEEGCLSLPGININVVRDKTLTIRARDVDGAPIEETATGYVPRIWQHEMDHLNGVMLTDRMGPVAKLTYRRKLKELEEDYAEAHPELAAKKTAAKKR